MDKEKIREYHKRYRETHKEKIKEYQKKYWKEHGEEINAKRQNRKSYKVRCKRAIEYIEDNYMTYKEANAYRDGIDNDYKIQISSIADLIDILKGTDKE